eukprot:5115088-Prymnesium_polylepis.1
MFATFSVNFERTGLDRPAINVHRTAGWRAAFSDCAVEELQTCPPDTPIAPAGCPRSTVWARTVSPPLIDSALAATDMLIAALAATDRSLFALGPHESGRESRLAVYE